MKKKRKAWLTFLFKAVLVFLWSKVGDERQPQLSCRMLIWVAADLIISHSSLHYIVGICSWQIKNIKQKYFIWINIICVFSYKHFWMTYSWWFIVTVILEWLENNNIILYSLFTDSYFKPVWAGSRMKSARLLPS